jgi:hypothetical protein
LRVTDDVVNIDCGRVPHPSRRPATAPLNNTLAESVQPTTQSEEGDVLCGWALLSLEFQLVVEIQWSFQAGLSDGRFARV